MGSGKLPDGGLPMSGDRSSLLDEHGDLGAEPGSRPWAVAVRREIQSGLKNVKSKAEHLEVMIRGFEKHHGYKQLNDWDGNPFVSYEYFCLSLLARAKNLLSLSRLILEGLALPLSHR
jgi:hypothetical protein